MHMLVHTWRVSILIPAMRAADTQAGAELWRDGSENRTLCSPRETRTPAREAQEDLKRVQL
jgi:hypothetical protein